MTFDDGLTASDNLEPLLSITLPGGQEITALDDTSNVSEPIRVAEGTKFADILTNVPLPSSNGSYPDYPLNDIIVNSHYWGDIDGDTNPTVTGKMKVKWQDVTGKDITDIIKQDINNIKLEGCSAPYQLTVEATDGMLSTAYGLPRQNSFIGSKHSYFFFPDTKKFCYAQPNLQTEDRVMGQFWYIYVHLGPDYELRKGYITNDSTHLENNFPTTGSNNLFFDLKLAGSTPQEIITYNGTVVNPDSGRGVSLSLSDHNGFLRVTLKGPSSASNGGDFSPTTFRLYSNSDKTDYLYGFTIQRWYIAFSGAPGGYLNTVNKCASLNGGYRVPTRIDYTNSTSNSDGYTRTVNRKNSDGKWNGGLFNEWGRVANDYFENSDWDDYYDDRFGQTLYWTIDEPNSWQKYLVETTLGTIGWYDYGKSDYRAACVTP